MADTLQQRADILHTSQDVHEQTLRAYAGPIDRSAAEHDQQESAVIRLDWKNRWALGAVSKAQG